MSGRAAVHALGRGLEGARRTRSRSYSPGYSRAAGQTLIEAGEFQDAQSALSSSTEVLRATPAFAVALARLQLADGDVSRALATLAGVASARDVQHVRGMALVRLGRCDAASEAFAAELRQRDDAHESCKALFKLAMRARTGAALEAANDRLPPCYRHSPVGKAYGPDGEHDGTSRAGKSGA